MIPLDHFSQVSRKKQWLRKNGHVAYNRARKDVKTLMYRWMGCALLAGVLLAGCGGEEEQQEAPEQEAKTAEETESETDGAANGTTTVKQPIEEADNIPPEEKEAILAVLDQYVQAFNNEDIDAYMETISENASFNHEEERAYVQQVFDTFDAKMNPEHVKIIQYNEDEKEAHVFVVMKSTTKDADKGKELEETTRQIMVFAKEEDGWKHTALSAMK